MRNLPKGLIECYKSIDECLNNILTGINNLIDLTKRSKKLESCGIYEELEALRNFMDDLYNQLDIETDDDMDLDSAESNKEACEDVVNTYGLDGEEPLYISQIGGMDDLLYALYEDMDINNTSVWSFNANDPDYYYNVTLANAMLTGIDELKVELQCLEELITSLAKNVFITRKEFYRYNRER